jgi:hypothetical protein
VVTARLMARDRAESVPADTIGHKPLARFRGGKIAADLAAEIDDRRETRDRIIGRALHL